MDNYYTKYLKYKNKYLELKRANGGVGVIGGSGVIGGGVGVMGGSGGVIRGGYLGDEPCPKTFGVFDFTLMSVWAYLRKYDCTFMTLLDKIPKKVEAITFDDFMRTNRDNPRQEITVQDLRDRGFTKKFLLRKGFLEEVLNKVWLPLEQLQTLKSQGHSAIKLYIADTQEPNLIKISKEIENGKKTLGHFVVREDSRGRFKFIYPISDLKKFFSIKDFRDAYELMKKNNKDRYDLEIDRPDLRDDFDDSEIDKIYGEKDLEEKDNTVQLRNLKIGIDKLKSYGFSAKELKDGGFSAKELKVAGYTNNDLDNAGYSEDEIEEIILIPLNPSEIAKMGRIR